MAERRADVATRRGSAATIDDLPKQLLTHTDTCTCTYVYVHVPVCVSVCMYIERYMYVHMYDRTTTTPVGQAPPRQHIAP